MTVMKKTLALFLSLIIVFSFPISVFAHASDSNIPSSDVFDWKDYEDALALVEYQVRISSEVTDQLSDHVISRLIEDNIIPISVLYSETTNEYVFTDFLTNNVTVDIFNQRQRASYCCDNMDKYWVTGFKYPVFSGGRCATHMRRQSQYCRSCGAFWGTLDVPESGCGGTQYYLYDDVPVCPYSGNLQYV